MRKLILFLAAVSLVLFAEKALCYETTFSIEPESFNSLRYEEMREQEAAPLSIRTGRFLSVDPSWAGADLARPQTWNRYVYADNNPILKVDPDGRSAVAVVGGGIVLIGGAILSEVYLQAPSAADPARTNAEVMASTVAEGLDELRTGLIAIAEHVKGKRPSTEAKHEKGKGRTKADKGGEKADWDPNKDDNKRRPPNKRPDWWPKKGPWPPKFVPVPVPEPPAPTPPKPPPPPPKDKDKEREPIVLLNRNAKDSNARYAV